MNSVSLRPNRDVRLARILILLAAFSCFIHFVAARIVIGATSIVFCLLKGTRDKIYADKGNIILTAFTLITSVVALVYGNYIGLLRTLVFAAMMVVFSVTVKIITKGFYELLLNVMCVGSSVATAYSIVEKIINEPKFDGYRCEVFFTNANFFGVAVMFVILICAYKVVSRVKNYFVYFAVAAFNAVGLYLSGSMSLWIIAAIGIVLLLIFNHDYKLLAVFLGAVICALTIIILIPQFVPRISEIGGTTDNRIKIWSFSIEQIKKSPIFGHGFFSYKHLYNTLSPTRPDIYKAALAHNLLLECLLSHGLVGTTLIGAYLGVFIKRLIHCHDGLKKYSKEYSHIIFAIATAAAVACYGVMDTTFIWVQSGMIFLFIVSGIGVDERKLKHIRKGNVK
ncbi:MAG: hypothetical protein U0M42_08060 [Acutalibacteraceae bacterium]|nr:hypothetical protein [Acutalibacteraceae bacterium]